MSVSAQAPKEAGTQAGTASGALRWFGRLQLIRLLGRSRRSMAWEVHRQGSEQPLMLVLPRAQPPNAQALQQWLEGARQLARLNHPHLAPVLEVGSHEAWPFLLHDLRQHATLADRLPASGMSGTEAVALMLQALQGLAYVHQAGLAHHDPQLFALLVSDKGQLMLAGSTVGCLAALPAGPGVGEPGDASVSSGWSPSQRGAPKTTDFNDLTDPVALQSQRQAAERDVLGMGLVLHHLAAGAPPLDEPDTGRVMQRLEPLGHEFLRLPFSLAQPMGDSLRAIINRSSDRQPRHRYRNARTLLRALEGWQQAGGDDNNGPLALLGERLRINGTLPSMPGAAARAARLALMESQRTNELAEVVLEDLAVSFEMLRLVNTAQVRSAQASGSGPVLTVRRAIAMLGLNGVRRAALTLRNWPGPLSEAGAAGLQQQIDRSRRAARVALLLRPPGYDGEVVYLVAVLQDLGRLVASYHFPDEMAQLRNLMRPGRPSRPGEAPEPGMSEQQASFAVLGVDIEDIGLAVARLWGLDDSVTLLIRRLPLSTSVHKAHDDDEMLRALASCAHEAVEVLSLPKNRAKAALDQVAQRYGHVLGVTMAEIVTALKDKSPLRISDVDLPAAHEAAAVAP